jgi:hypothetical protein
VSEVEAVSCRAIVAWNGCTLLQNQGVDDIVVGEVPKLVRLEDLSLLVDTSTIGKADYGGDVQLLLLAKLVQEIMLLLKSNVPVLPS